MTNLTLKMPVWLIVPVWEVLNGVGVDGVGVILPFFYAFFIFFFFLTHFFVFVPLFFVFLRFSLLLLKDKGKQQQNLLQKWGISLRPRLHRPRAKLPDPFRSPECQFFLRGEETTKKSKRSNCLGQVLRAVLYRCVLT